VKKFKSLVNFIKNGKFTDNNISNLFKQYKNKQDL